MNDRFKFRVWLPDENRYLHNTDCPVIDSDGNLMWCYLNPFGHWEHHKMEDAVIEQCTGIKDKNGRLIYDGDILRATCTDGKHIDYPVGWWDGAFHLYYVDKSLIAETGTIQFCLRGLVSVKNCCYREIIGNIHDKEVEK
jgi:uncharacterized phage protein (TIGR01671 family)